MEATEHRGDFEMERHKRYPIRMEYYQHTNNSEASLSWSGPGLAKQIIAPEWLSARKPEGQAAPRRDSGLVMRGGSFLVGSVTRADTKAVHFTTSAGEKLRIPELYIASIQLGRIDAQRHAAIADREPGCLLRTGDYFESSVLEVEGGGKVRASSILFGVKTFQPGHVLYIKLNKPGKPDASFEVHTKSGSRLRADGLDLDGEGGLARDNSRYRIRLEPGDVASVRGVVGEVPE